MWNISCNDSMRQLSWKICFCKLGCGCNPIGMESCSGFQKCHCKSGYSGDTCSQCTAEYYKYGNQGNQCFSKNASH